MKSMFTETFQEIKINKPITLPNLYLFWNLRKHCKIRETHKLTIQIEVCIGRTVIL